MTHPTPPGLCIAPVRLTLSSLERQPSSPWPPAWEVGAAVASVLIPESHSWEVWPRGSHTSMVGTRRNLGHSQDHVFPLPSTI